MFAEVAFPIKKLYAASALLPHVKRLCGKVPFTFIVSFESSKDSPSVSHHIAACVTALNWSSFIPNSCIMPALSYGYPLYITLKILDFKLLLIAGLGFVFLAHLSMSAIVASAIFAYSMVSLSAPLSEPGYNMFALKQYTISHGFSSMRLF